MYIMYRIAGNLCGRNFCDFASGALNHKKNTPYKLDRINKLKSGKSSLSTASQTEIGDRPTAAANTEKWSESQASTVLSGRGSVMQHTVTNITPK